MRAPHYDLRLNLEPTSAEFFGEASIRLEDAPRSPRLHAKDLRIDEVQVDGASHPFALFPATGELELVGVPAGAHEVRVRFRGEVPAKALIGLYRTPYPPGSLLTTMLYPNGARRLFPCLDEPAAKAVFEVTVETPSDAGLVFNTPEVSRTVRDGRATVRFAPTPRMSTYLLYLGVGPFAYLEGDRDGVRISVAAPAGREPAGQFALEHAARVLGAYNQYYGIPYPLPKLHLVSVPDFWAGAMENWGAIAFHETRLLVEPATGTRIRRRVRETVTHEIAHQWFGNLVTMASWDDFWLNESFATFMQAKLDGALYPNLDTWSDFLLTFTRWGLGGDQLRATHAIASEVRGPEDLGQLADEISYGKGSSVLGMIEAYLGEEAFRRGVTEYLQRFAYQNARSEDLWGSLERAANEPVARIMAAWVRTPGMPVVRVERTGTGLHLAQRRYLLDGTTAEGRWPIPLTYDLAGRAGRALFEGESMDLPAPPGAPVLINPGRTGFYRVLYEPALFAELLERYETLGEVDRWGLLGDAFAFTLSGNLGVGDYARLLARAAESPAVLTGGEVLAGFVETEPFLDSVPVLKDAYVGYVGRALEAIGPGPAPNEAEAVGGFRTSLAILRARRDPAFAEEWAARFDRLEGVPADLRVPVITAYAIVGGEAAAEVLVDRMMSAPTEEVARQFSTGLAYAPDAPSVARTLSAALDPRMPASRTWQLLGTLGSSTHETGTVWAWFRDHLREVERLLSGTPLLYRTLEGGLPNLGLGREQEVHAFFSANRFPEAQRGVDKGLELLDVNRRFLDRVARTPTG